MKTIKRIFILFLLLVMGNITDAAAQNWLKRLGKRAEDAAKRKVERKLEEKVDKTMDNVFDKAEDGVRKKNNGGKTSIIEPPDTGTPAGDISEWDDNKPYYALKKGTKIVYTFYDGKGRVNGYNNQEIKEITHTINSVKAVVSGRYTDAKGKECGSATVSLRFNNGNFHVNLLDMMLPKEMGNLDLDAEVAGRDMMIPAELAPGQILPEAEAGFRMKMKNGDESFELPPLVFRVFNRRAVRAESVETPVGKFVCFKIIQTVEADYPLVGKRLSTSVTWIGKGIGTVKAEGYDAKGKLVSRMLLTGLENDSL